MDSSQNDLELLQKLINSHNGNSSDSDSDDDHLPKVNVQLTPPSDLHKKFRNNSFATSTSNSLNGSTLVSSAMQTVAKYSSSKAKTNEINSLEEWEEHEAFLDADDVLNTRRCPTYKISYKQSITPEDIYLQISNRTPATASCEEICVEIAMPDETVAIDKMDLKIVDNSIDLSTPIYRLKLPLVQVVEPDQGRAVWNSQRKLLNISLRMKREFDFINF